MGIIGFIKGDTRSFVYSSCDCVFLHGVPDMAHVKYFLEFIAKPSTLNPKHLGLSGSPKNPHLILGLGFRVISVNRWARIYCASYDENPRNGISATRIHISH